MQTNRKSFGTFKNDRYVQVAVVDEWPLWQVLLYITVGRDRLSHLMSCDNAPNCTWTDLAIPTLAGVNCAKHWEESI